MPDTGFSSASDAAYDQALAAASSNANTPIPTHESGSAPAADPATPRVEATSFDQFALHPDILRAISDQGYTQPTPIQAQAIPVVLDGRDIMGAAQTGTGARADFDADAGTGRSGRG